MSCSFHINEPGLDYGEVIAMPKPPGTEKTNYKPWREKLKGDSTGAGSNQKIRAIKPTTYFDSEVVSFTSAKEDANLQVWLRSREPIEDDPAVQNSRLAYVSDLGLLLSTLTPHGFKVFELSLIHI